MKTGTIKIIGLTLALTFAAVGAIFLLAPETVLRGLNSLARSMGAGESPLHDPGFFSVMTAAYMAGVTILAFRIYLFPAVPLHPLLLAQTKAASSLLSFGGFLFHRPDFILLANGLVDGSLALLVFLIYRSVKSRKNSPRTP